jgi:hypothetical protein
MMKNSRLLTTTLLVASVLVSSIATAQVIRSDDELMMSLTGPDQQARAEAVAYIHTNLGSAHRPARAVAARSRISAVAGGRPGPRLRWPSYVWAFSARCHASKVSGVANGLISISARRPSVLAFAAT